MDIVGLQDALDKLNGETIPRVEKLLADAMARADRLIDEDYAKALSDLTSVVRDILSGVQSVLDTVPYRIRELIGDQSLAALLDGRRVVITIEAQKRRT